MSTTHLLEIRFHVGPWGVLPAGLNSEVDHGRAREVEENQAEMNVVLDFLCLAPNNPGGVNM